MLLSFSAISSCSSNVIYNNKEEGWNPLSSTNGVKIMPGQSFSEQRVSSNCKENINMKSNKQRKYIQEI